MWLLNIWAAIQIQRKICQAEIKSVKIICNNPVLYALCMSDFNEYCFNCTDLAMKFTSCTTWLPQIFFKKIRTFIYVLVNLWNTQMNTIYLFYWHDGTVKNLYYFTTDKICVALNSIIFLQTFLLYQKTVCIQIQHATFML